MQERRTADPEHRLEQTADELEERLGRLDQHIDDTRRVVTARSEEAEPFEDVAGDWEDTDDDSGGADPSEFDDPESIEEDEDEDI